VILNLREWSPRDSIRTSIEVCAGLLDLTWRSVSEKPDEDERLIDEAKKLMPSPSLMALVWSLAAVVVGIIVWLVFLGLPLVFAIFLFLFVIGGAGSYIDWKREPYLWILRWYGLK
jgi:hypothetical protein